jgi:cell wall-associated NlpC family hydrolase
MSQERSVRIVAVPTAPVLKAPHGGSSLVTEALLGERVLIEESGCDLVKAELEEDGYVGHMAAETLALPGPVPTHRIVVPKTFRFSAPDIKSRVLGSLYLNCRVAVSEEDGEERFARLEGGGCVLKAMIAPLGVAAGDPAAVAEDFVGVPYLWGGKSYEGIDCSGLVQLALQASGIKAPRDSHMIEAAVGMPLEGASEASLRRGDLVFWKGHVGMMLDEKRIIHANGHHMKVVIEPLSVTIARIAALGGGMVTSVRRVVSSE